MVLYFVTEPLKTLLPLKLPCCGGLGLERGLCPCILYWEKCLSVKKVKQLIFIYIVQF